MVLGFLYFFDAISWLTMRTVHAYIDPSAVTYVIQATAGIFIALGAEIAIFRHRIIAFLRGKRKLSQSAEEERIILKNGPDSLDEILVEQA